jgi:ectoine hydroxylase-related dioxygenase (phytanoyl-CoA dioxygenase family)
MVHHQENAFMGKRLTELQRQFYQKNGYIIGLPPVFTSDQVRGLNRGLDELMKLLKPGEDAKEIREWHESSRFLFDICMNATILDYVEDILGPDFYLWGSNFFIKPPRSSTTVGWHQDTYYWPLEPKISATVWVAFEDVDKQNAAMQVIPGSHVAGLLKHSRSSDTDSVLTLECERGQFREDAAVSLTLRAGEVSIHDDKLVHGSPANHSDRRRAGLTIRYSSTEVRCDLSVNPHFTTYLCRGVDEFKYNPVGTVPVQQYGRLDRKHVSVEEAGRDAERKLGLIP